MRGLPASVEVNAGNSPSWLALYRGALNREPDSSGFNFWLNKLNTGTSWTTAVDDMFTSSEFTGDAATFCTQGPYYFGGATAITIPLGQGCSGQFCFTGGTQQQLQTMLTPRRWVPPSRWPSR